MIQTENLAAKPETCDTIVWVCGDFRFFSGILEKFLREIKLQNYYMQANPGGLLRLYTSRDALDSIMEYCKYVNIKQVVIITHCSIQGRAIKRKYGEGAGLHLVFHGGSGSTREEIWETLEYGVVKMNIDTDTQYAFTRPIADHMLKNYDGVLKVENEVGNKKLYDPRSYLKLAEKSMSKRVIEACEVLRSAGRTLYI